MGGWDMVTHHISAFISVIVTVWYGEAHMYTLILLSTECTTPFINFRWLLEKLVSLLKAWDSAALHAARNSLHVTWCLHCIYTIAALNIWKNCFGITDSIFYI